MNGNWVFLEIESFGRDDTRWAKSCIFVVIPQAEQAPKETKSKEMFLEASFVIEEDSNDDDNDNNNNNNNNSCSSLRAGNTGLMSGGG